MHKQIPRRMTGLIKLLGCSILITLYARTADCFYVSGQEPLDGPNRVLRDDLLDELIGNWKLTGKVGNRIVENTVKAEWVLNHQFVLVHMKDVSNPPTYE